MRWHPTCPTESISAPATDPIFRLAPPAGHAQISTVSDSVSRVFPAQSGHFLLESGHHGDLWLDLEILESRSEALRAPAAALADRLAAFRPDAICGPESGGAHLARLVAACLGVPALATEKLSPATAGSSAGSPDKLYLARYDLRPTDRSSATGRRIALVDDVINAGSATQASLAALARAGARPVAIGALLVLNEQAARLAASQGLPLVFLGQRTGHLWDPAACPLCAQQVPLTLPA